MTVRRLVPNLTKCAVVAIIPDSRSNPIFQQFNYQPADESGVI